MNISFCRWSMVVKLYIVHLYIVHTSYIGHRSFVHPASLFDAGILLYRFGGDSGGGFGGVGGLHVGGGCRDRPQRFAGHCSEGDCSEDDRAKQHNGQ